MNSGGYYSSILIKDFCRHVTLTLLSPGPSIDISHSLPNSLAVERFLSKTTHLFPS